MTEFLPRTLWFATRDLKIERVSQGDLATFKQCLIILGEPGMGKTSLLKDVVEVSDAAPCTAQQLINRHNPRTLLGNAELLVIDALDEVPAGRQGDAVDLVLRKLGELDYPRFVLSCRAADWRAATANRAINEQYSELPLELHLEPLDRDQQHALLTQRTSAARADTLLVHFERYQLDFLGNPQTLDMIAALPEKEELPKTSSALMRLSTDQLRREHKDGKTELPADVALDAAGGAFAAILLTGSSRIVHTPTAKLNEGELPFQEVQALAGDALLQVIGTRLFEGQSDHSYRHRRIGEYLAARWLARRADTPGKRKRVLSMLWSEGRVPASLRGVHAWLALDEKFASAVIAADPMGLIEYGDADVLTVAQAKLLLNALERLSRDNPRFVGWGDYRAGSLLASPLQNEVLTAIADRSREFSLRKLLIDQLRGQTLTTQMHATLVALLRDRDEPFALRERAGELLISAGGIDWPTELDTIRCQADHSSARLAYELMDDVGLDLFSDLQIVETVFIYDGLSLCFLPRGRQDNTVGRFWKLAREIPPERLDGLLNLFADYAKALLPRHAGLDEHELLDLHYKLVLRRLELGAPAPLDLWSWLEHFEGQPTYRRGPVEELSDWLKAHDDVRRALQRHFILGEALPNDWTLWRRALHLSHASSGFAPSAADVLQLLAELDPADRSDDRWRDLLNLTITWGDEGKEIREAAKKFAAHRPDVLGWIDSLAVRPEPEWERKQRERDRKERARKAVAYAEHRNDFLNNIDAVRAGEFRFALSTAQAYLKKYRDISDDDAAHERIAAWVGIDVAEAAHAGFESFLHITPPRPHAKRMAVSFAKGTRWNAGDIIVAALAERLRTRDSPFDGVTSERLMAGLFEVWHTRIDDHAKIGELQASLEIELRSRGDFECAVRVYIEPQLKKRKEHVDHLYALMRSDEYRGAMRAKLAEDWLWRFPEIPGGPESELIDGLLSAGHSAALLPLVNDRLGRTLDDDRRRNWDAIQVVVDFDAARVRLEGQGVEAALLWHLRERSGDRRRDEDRVTVPFKVAQLDWIITTFRALFPSVGYPSGVQSGDTNPWDATDYLRGLATRLAQDVSDEAVAALEHLCNAPSDGYTDAFKIYADEQRQSRAEQLYISPSLSDVRAVVEGGPPTNARDLQAVLIDALEQAQARLKGDPLDWYKNFFREDDRHKNEEPCRDALLQMLDGNVGGIALRPEDHGADDKRVDIVAQIAPKIIVPIEVKGQWHPDLWTAADKQLDHLYVNDWRAEHGIYLVLWFGADVSLKPAPAGKWKPSTPQELKTALEASAKAASSGRIAIVVLDLTRPQPL